MDFQFPFPFLVSLVSLVGARIGLADELKFKWKIAWINPDNQNKGFKYIYLTEADYLALNKEQEVTCD